MESYGLSLKQNRKDILYVRLVHPKIGIKA